jgi:hypothetical protein
MDWVQALSKATSSDVYYIKSENFFFSNFHSLIINKIYRDVKSLTQPHVKHLRRNGAFQVKNIINYAYFFYFYVNMTSYVGIAVGVTFAKGL